MTTKSRFLTMAVVSGLALGSMSVAQADSYLSIFGGYTDLDNTTFSSSPVKTRATFDGGYLVGAAYGVSMSSYSNWRLEGELSYRQNDIDKLRQGGVSLPGARGDVSATALMLNTYYDFRPSAAFSPYLGVGLGGANVSANNIRSSSGKLADDDDTVFAYQGMAGIGFQASSTTDLFAEVRYFGTDSPSVGRGVDFDYDTLDILIGARFRF